MQSRQQCRLTKNCKIYSEFSGEQEEDEEDSEFLTKQKPYWTKASYYFTWEKSRVHMDRNSMAGKQNVDMKVAMPRPWEAVMWPVRPAM